MSQRSDRNCGYSILSVPVVFGCLGILAAAFPARGFEAGPKTTAHWIFDSAHVEDGAFKNLAPVPGPELESDAGGAPDRIYWGHASGSPPPGRPVGGRHP